MMTLCPQRQQLDWQKSQDSILLTREHAVLSPSFMDWTSLIRNLDRQFPYDFLKVDKAFGSGRLVSLSVRPKEVVEEKLLEQIPNFLQPRARPLLSVVISLCQKYQVDPFWVISILWTESHFSLKALSPVGAKGPMQIMPATRSYLLELIKKQQLGLAPWKLAPEQARLPLLNIELGIFYLKTLLKIFGGNHTLATVSYNMGPGWTLKRKREGLPVGVKNRYLDKIRLAYERFERISQD